MICRLFHTKSYLNNTWRTAIWKNNKNWQTYITIIDETAFEMSAFFFINLYQPRYVNAWVCPPVMEAKVDSRKSILK